MLKLLCYLKRNIPFYDKYIPNDILNSINETYGKIIFESLPVIDRSIVNNNFEDFISSSFPRKLLVEIKSQVGDSTKEYRYVADGIEYWVECTSGTTGMPLIIIKSTEERVKLGASLWRMRRKFSDVLPEELFCFMHNKKGGYPFPIDEINLEYKKIKELQFLEKQRYKWWHVFPVQLEKYVEYISSFEILLQNLEVIECNGAFISRSDMQRYSEIFNCRVANNYGCREVWNIAYSCRQGNLHLNDDNIIFELIDSEGEVISNPYQIGEIVVSSKNLKVMPFIRYKTGDYGFYEEGGCCADVSKVINLDTNRNRIMGTNLCGTDVFRTVIFDLQHEYGINKFESINVVQDKINEFKVFVRNCSENRNVFEVVFEKNVTRVLNRKIICHFEYDVLKEHKSLFVAIK